MQRRTIIPLFVACLLVAIGILMWLTYNPKDTPERADVRCTLVDHLFEASLVRDSMTLHWEEGGSHKYLLYGWSPRERGDSRSFSWSNQANSAFFVPLMSDGDLILRITARPFEHPTGDEQRITIGVNGRDVTQLTLLSGWQTYDIRIPGTFLQRGNNMITFHYAWTISPRAAGMGADIRQLAVCFEAIRITRRQETQPPSAFIGDETGFHLTRTGGREVPAISIPPDGAVTFRILVPDRARLRTKLGISPAGGAEASPLSAKDFRTTFSVSYTDRNGGDKRTIFERRWPDSADKSLRDNVEQLVSPLFTSEEIIGGREVLLTLETHRARENDLPVLPTLFVEPEIVGHWHEAAPISTTTAGALAGQKVFLIGLDGLTWDIVTPMLRQGELPHLKTLIDRGYSSPFRSLMPSKSPMLWTSIATGKKPEKHGIDDYLSWDAERGERIPITVNVRRTKALWNILSDLGKQVMVVGWWPTWPAEEVNGFVVADRYAGQELPHQTWPEELWSEIDRHYRPEPFDDRRFFPESLDLDKNVLGQHILSPAERSAIVDQLIRVQQRDEYFTFCVEYLLERHQTDFLAVYLNGIDPVCHMFWRYRYPEMFGVGDEEKRLFGDVIGAYYRYTDELLGRILAVIPPDSTVFVVSDHGFEGEYKRSFKVDLIRLLELTGFLVRSAEGWVDKTKSQLLQGPSIDASLDHHIVIAPWLKAEQGHLARLKPEVENRIGSITSRLTASKPFSIVWQDGPGYDFTIIVNYWPLLDEELLFGDRSIPFSEIFPEDFVSGSHGWAPDGLFIAAGPAIRPATLIGRDVMQARNSTMLSPILMDIVPTILTMMGYPIGSDMDGRPLVELLDPKEIPVIRAVPGYDSIGSRNVVDRNVIPSKQDDAIRNQLRSLGYIQ